MIDNMGTPKISNTKPQLAHPADKKSIKNILKKPFQAIFHKKSKNNETKKEIIEQKETAAISREQLLETLNYSKPKETPRQLLLEVLTTKDDDDFTYKVVKETQGRNIRSDSHSSGDSGFSDSKEKKDYGDPIEESLKKLNINDKVEEKTEKKKRLQTVYLSRAPIRNKIGDLIDCRPYQQISQINRQTFTGGQVIVNSGLKERKTEWTEIPDEINKALTEVDRSIDDFVKNSHQEQIDRWDLAQEFITEVSKPFDDVLSDFVEVQTNGTAYILNDEFFNIPTNLTPPHSNEMSPNSIPSPNVYCTPSYKSLSTNSPLSDYTLMSPERNSPNVFQNYSPNEYEICQEFSDTDLPSCLMEEFDSQHNLVISRKEDDCKGRERIRRTSSINMSTVKRKLTELASDFAKKTCCQKRENCRKIFQEYFQQLSEEERKNLCLRITNMDLKMTYGVLQHLLLSLSEPKCQREELHYSMFSLMCERILAQSPNLLLGDFGLNLLKAATLRCYARPLLVQYLVQCIRSAMSDASKKAATPIPLFTEVDALGDNLICACARAGDTCSDVLAEIVKCESNETPLFDIHHTNSDGYSALHIACLQHNTGDENSGLKRSCLHTVHVLIAHGGVDLTKGDIKGGDTPLHHAVNSVSCDLQLVLALFQHVPRSSWRNLAHAPNRSSITPLEYARSASKSTSRQNYPPEILDFLKKCR